MSWLRRLLNARSRQEMAGLVLADPRWEVVGLTSPSRLFQALPQLIPADSLLFLEGGEHPPELQTFLEGQNVDVAPRPALGTLWPATPYFSIRGRPEVLHELASLVAPLPYPQVCHHLHVFLADRVLLSGHDAFSNPFYVSGDVPEARLKEFCATAGCAYQPA